MNKFKLLCIFCLVAVSCWSCGMSEGQTVNMYVSQMTVYERRVEADSYELGKVCVDINGKINEDKKKELLKILGEQEKRFQATQEAIKDSHCPTQCSVLRDKYSQAFKLRIEHCQLLSNYLRNEYGKEPVDEKALEQLKEQNKKIAEETKKVDEELRTCKADLASRYPEVEE